MNKTIEAILSQDLAQARILQLISTENGELTIEETERYRWVRDNYSAYYSILDKTQPERLVLPYLQFMMAVLLFISEPKMTLLLGAGGGALLRFLNKYFPNSVNVAIDNDYQIIEATNKYFLIEQPDTRRIKNIDAMNFISLSSKRNFDLIFVDLFSHGAIPNFFKQVEFYQQCKRSLAAGVIAFNLILDTQADFKLIMSHLLFVFNKRCLCLTVPDYKNIIVLAFNDSVKSEQDISVLRDKCKKLSAIYDIEFEILLDEIIATNVCINNVLQF